MSRPKTTQEIVHWLEEGEGARWLLLGAVLAITLLGSLRVAWTQFHGPLTEATLLQADMGRQLASGAGFTTLVNYPQTAAVMAQRGHRFDPQQPYPELTQAPLYALVIAGGLRLLPAGVRESLFAKVPAPPLGFGGDYFLLGLNLLLFWLAAWLTYDLGRRLFAPRVGWVAALALLVSVSAWQQVVAVNGVSLLMVLALAAFWIWLRVEQGSGEGEDALPAWLAGLGVVCGLLFLSEYSAGALVLVALGYAGWRFHGRARVVALVAIAAGFLVISTPWLVRNLRQAGHPVALAAQNVALKAGDPTAEPATFRTRLATDLPHVDLNKLGNKALTSVQDNVKSQLWSGGGLFLTAFFVAGWLYTFRAPAANRLRWLFTAAFAALVVSQAFFNSGETERLPVLWLSPLVMIFGAAFFFVLLEASAGPASWPRTTAAVLLLAQALPLVRDALEPRRLHFFYPPYYPTLLAGLRIEMEQRGAIGRFGVMADVPAGAAWYGRQRVWAQPARLRDFYAITVDQPMGILLLTPHTLDRPFFSELALRGPLPGSLAEVTAKFGEWGQIYSAFLTGKAPPEFPLTVPQKLADNLYVLFNPALPPPRGK
ncbi:MAG TPA: glycosyltransferase family 39 protein [Opitutaceae bacterium]|nr:glycosyltransferase family 39 protein [Opitutaceae bacterium]